MSWTDERIETLRKLWEQGNTASQIAEILGGVSRNAVIGKAHRLGLQARPSPVKASEPVEASGAAPAPAPPVAAAPPPPPPPAAPRKPVESAPEPQPAAARPQAPAYNPITATGAPLYNPDSPMPQAPPRRLVPAKPSAEIADKTSLLDLSDKICRWPIGHPGEPDFHFCGQPSNPGFPYCTSHCAVAYQAQLPRRDRRPPPPMPFGAPRVR
jgi:GcrA cell cycle regulator